MKPTELWGLIIQGVGVVCTIVVAILAIWGDLIRSRFAGPKLRINLRSSKGELNYIQDRTPTLYYHLRVVNKRRGAQAKNVRVVLTGLLKSDRHGKFVDQTLSGPLQLTWQFPNIHPQYPTIGPEDFCDLGNLIKCRRFVLSPYVIPNNFTGYLDPNEKMRVEVIAVADNAESNPMCIEVSWDGLWSDDANQMEKHLVIAEVEGGSC
jgi:hypothetical protein